MALILLINYDNGSHIPMFPQGLAYLSSSMKKQGHTVYIWDQAINHEPAENLTRLLNCIEYDLVGLGFVAGYYQFKVCLELARAINKSHRRKDFKFILGGHGPAGAPDYFLSKFEADTVIKGEADNVLWESVLLNINPEPPDPDEVPWPDYAAFNMGVYRLIRWPTSKATDFCMPILSGRGCPFKCTFCFRMSPGFRPRDPWNVIREMEWLWSEHRINHFQFSDELLMSGPGRTRAFVEALLGWGLAIPGFKWDCNGRLNYATPDLLLLMKRAGCEYINYGIESLDQDVLDGMNKALTLKQIHEGVKATLDAGISPGLNFIWGFPGDTKKALYEAVKFLCDHDPCDELRTIRPVTPYPGCALYQEALDKRLLTGAADFYENRHVNSDWPTVNFTDIPNDKFIDALRRANITLIRNNVIKRQQASIDHAIRFYAGKYMGFRGFRAV